ncbi:hypothetical protein GN958_ATG00844, partial [Phytophthora infestans]
REEFSDAEITRPTEERWCYLPCLDRLLVIFELVAKVLSGETYPTIMFVFPCARLLKKRLINKVVFAKVSPAPEGKPFPEIENTPSSPSLSVPAPDLISLAPERCKSIAACWIRCLYNETPLIQKKWQGKSDSDVIDPKAPEGAENKQKVKRKLTNGLIWRRQNSGDYPHLAPAARKRFGIVVASV